MLKLLAIATPDYNLPRVTGADSNLPNGSQGSSFASYAIPRLGKGYLA